MADEAERVVIALIGDTGSLDSKSQAAARNFDRSMDTIEQSAKSAENQVRSSSNAIAVTIERNSARIGNAQRNLGRQISDIGTQFAGGQSPFLIIAQQAPQVADALADTGGAAARVASFFAGPWGAALLAAGSALGVLVGKIFESNDALEAAIDKLRKDAEQTDINRQAKERFANTEAGVAAAIADAAEAHKQSIEAQRTDAEQTNIAAKANLAKEIAIRKVTLALLEQAKAEAAAANSQTFGAGGGAGAGMAQAIYARQVSDLESKIKDQTARLAQAEANLAASRADLAEEAAKRATDPIAKINKQFDDEVNAAKNAAVATKNVTVTLTDQITAIEKRRKAALKAEQERQQAQRQAEQDAKRNYQTGRQITLDQAKTIVAGVGGRVTSGFRSYDQQAALYAKYRAGTGVLAAKPGTSDHEFGQAVDVAKTAGVTLGKLVQAFKAQGVSVKQALDEGTHFHIAFGDRAKTQAQVAREEKRLADDQIRDAQLYTDQVASLNAQILQARQAQVLDADKQADLERQLVLERADKMRQQILADQKLGRYGEGAIGQQRAQSLLVLNALAANEQIGAINATEADRKRRERAGLTINDLQDQRDILRQQGDLARSSAERRDIALRLVDLDIQIEQAKIDELRASRDAVDREEGARRQGLLDQRRALATEAARRDNMSPGQRYADSLNWTPGQMADQFEQFGVNTLERFNSELDDSVKKALHLHGIFGDIVADLVDMVIKQALIRPIANALFGGGDNNQQGSGIGGAVIGAVKTVGHLFGLASGGYAAPNSIHRVNEHAGGVELLRMGPQGGTVIPLGEQKAASGMRGGDRIYQISVYAQNSVTPAGFAQGLAQQILAEADRMDAVRQTSTLKSAPGAVQRAQTLQG